MVGSFSPSVVLEVARRAGLLDGQGLAVEEVPVVSSPAQFRSLLDGELDAALTSPDNAIAYRFTVRNPLGVTADVRILAAVDRGLGLGLYARPGLTAADLRGARVGVDVPTSGFALALYELAASLGVDRDDYELVTLGSTPRRLEALLAGACDATMLNAGSELRAEAAGCELLASVAQVCPPYLGTVLAVVGEDRLEPARRLGAALAAAAAGIVGGQLRALALAAAAARLDVSPTLAGRYVERLASPTEGLVPDGVVDPASLATLVRLRSAYLPGGEELRAAATAADNGLVAR